ncbi:MAG: hypothetical protein EAZ89_01825 [Bacteroidetes bacterium]|nr:MAG: hypothetical protein EAZ89_01825 [Bacteroidota bacterium]
MNTCKVLILLGLVWHATGAYAQNTGTQDASPSRKYAVSTSYLSLTNQLGVENIAMYELFVSYRITPKDVLGIKAVTWRLYQPLGIPLWDPALLSDTQDEWYPGRLREYGIGVRYQRFLWKGLFASVEAVPMRKVFLDENRKKMGTGFRLYTSLHAGYHVSFLKNRIFIEPQVHCNYWPIDTRGPQGFAEKENKWNNYFLFEPNLYIGVKF